MQSSESFELGITSYFNCSINPDPIGLYQSAELRYSWTINGVSSWITTLSHTSLYVNPKYTKYNYLFCQVKVNDNILGIGQYLIKVKGKKVWKLLHFFTQKILNQICCLN